MKWKRAKSGTVLHAPNCVNTVLKATRKADKAKAEDAAKLALEREAFEQRQPEPWPIVPKPRRTA